MTTLPLAAVGAVALVLCRRGVGLLVDLENALPRRLFRFRCRGHAVNDAPQTVMIGLSHQRQRFTDREGFDADAEGEHVLHILWREHAHEVSAAWHRDQEPALGEAG